MQGSGPTHERSTSIGKALLALSLSVGVIAGCPGADSTIASVPPEPYVSAQQGAVVASGASGTGGKNVVPIVTGVKPAGGQECDMCINGVSNCGGPCGGGGGGVDEDPGSNVGGGSCGSPGQCACSVGNYGLIGFCASAAPSAVCTYCPPGTSLADPCGTKCKVDDEEKGPKPEGTHCPDDYPVACGNKSCCPSSHSFCCGNTAFCGTSSTACKDVDAPPPSSGGGSSSGGGGCSWSCPGGFRKASLRTGCCSVGACPDSCSDACGNGWYEARGSLFGPCSVQNTSCMQNAARGALNACR